MEIDLKDKIDNIQNIKDKDKNKNELNSIEIINSVDKKQEDLEKEHINNYNRRKSHAGDFNEKNKIPYNSQNSLKKEIERKYERTDSFDNDEFNSIILNNYSYLNNTFGQSFEERIEINCGEEKGKTFDLCKCKCGCIIF